MEFIRCDRCKKEIPYKDSWTRLEMSTLTREHVEGSDNVIRTMFNEVDLCDDCVEGLYVYLQRKVDNYADLVKM